MQHLAIQNKGVSFLHFVTRKTFLIKKDERNPQV